MLKYYLIVVAVLLLALGGTGWLLKQSYASNGKQAAEITALQDAAEALAEQGRKDRALISKHAQAKVQLQNKADRLRSQLDAALAQHADWAAQPLPKEVQDALQP